MCDLIFDAGIDTESWYAEFAFRRRVSMSAIGSVMVMNWPSASLAGVSRCPSLSSIRDEAGAVRWTYGVVSRTGSRQTPNPPSLSHGREGA
ncbi:hypothetical protein GCM10010276_67830 [Streptomyces longisporus]|uniref:Uncharacterized protein n=1 Tax=Streptomyces longisporus TaxID=1948 RepID=A0ABN3MZD3_STRLO